MKKSLILACSAALLLALAGCGGASGDGSVVASQTTQVQNDWWPTDGLGAMVPAPASNNGEVKTNSASTFKAEVLDSDESAFTSYVEQCKESGFTVDEEVLGVNFEAYNKDGYRVAVNFWKDDNKFYVTVEEPLQLSDISWPTVGPASVVPAPSSLKGYLDVDSDSSYNVLIGETPIEDYSSYVDGLISAGFNVDYDRSEKWFKATNAEGYQVIAEYMGYNTMRVGVDAPEA